MGEKDEVIGDDFYDQNIAKPDPKEEKEVEVDQEAIQKDQDKIFGKDLLADLKEDDVDVSVDFSKLSKTNYLYTIFSPKVDNYKSSYYLEKIHKKYRAEGYPEGTVLNNYLFIATVLRRLQIQYQENHKAGTDQGVARPEDLPLLDKIQGLSDKCNRIQKALDDQRNAMRSGSDIHDLHQKELDENSKFVQEHIGEFSFRCEKCQTIVSSGGLPHWAFEIDRGEKGDPLYHVWSQELFYAVKKGVIPLHMMAFSLQTSIEGLNHTATERGDKMPEYNVLAEEQALLKLIMGFESA